MLEEIKEQAEPRDYDDYNPIVNPADTEPMYSIRGITTTKPSLEDTYRVVYGSDRKGGNADGFPGVSGAPVLDGYGNVVAIFSGLTRQEITPRRSMAVGMDGDLYNFLSKYK